MRRISNRDLLFWVYFIVLIVIFITNLFGCSTGHYVPTAHIEAPHPTVTPCPPLKEATQNNFLQTAVENNGLYLECQARVNMIISFYNTRYQ